MVARLNIESGGKSRMVEIPENSVLSLGRLESSDIVLNDMAVSRRHATIFSNGGECFIEDNASTAGTWINGEKILGRRKISNSDKIKIGSFEITVSMPERGQPVASRIIPLPENAPQNSSSRMPLYDVQTSTEMYSDIMLELARTVQSRVLEILNMSGTSANKISAEAMKPKVEDALEQILREIRHRIPSGIQIEKFRAVLMDDLIGFGPLSPLLRDPDISEIMINGPDNIFIESKGIQYRTAVRFNGESHLQSIIQRIVEPLGRHIDAASPMVDARLDDGSRVNAVIPPLSLDGSLVTIRKFASKKLTDDDLIKFGSLNRPMALFLKEAVRSRQNILVSGGTGSGKTTLLNILSQFIPEKERVITVEDSAELKLSHENLCRLEARPANIEGQGRVTIRDLVINTLRMRPDRIIVGECRGAEALDMLQAMNTGHDGSMTTCHANNPRDALSRLENMVMMAGFELPSSAIREQIASAINLIVQQTRMPDGSRKIVKITEVCGRENNTILLQDIFSYEQEGYDENFKVVGRHTATGNIPRFMEELRQSGDLKLDMSVFVPES